MGYVDYDNELSTLEGIKEARPDCTDDRGHFWVTYRGTNTHVCEECGYEEELVERY